MSFASVHLHTPQFETNLNVLWCSECTPSAPQKAQGGCGGDLARCKIMPLPWLFA
jgi:hypothetical protein